MPTIHEQLTRYLSDAHSIEEQALAQLRSAPRIAGSPKLALALAQHLDETEGHERIVRGLLETREASPSWFKDTVMKLGGKGFILFARANPDTPGKLLAHALSYEALEEASYALLELVALKADEDDVAMRAAQIGGEELAMQGRLEACFDEAVELALAVGADDPRDQLRRYLADAHAIEMQSVGLLERASAPESGVIAEVYQHHLAETQDHAEAIESQLKSLGGDPSSVKDTALRVGAANWTSLFEAQPDTPGKLAAFTYAFEHLEIGGYEQLRRVAERIGDLTTAQLAAYILEQERTAAAVLRDLFPVAAELSLAAARAPG